MAFLLNTGACIPAIAIGTAGRSLKDDDTRAAVLQALKAGYRHIDTASFYGTEAAVGQALAQAFRTGVVKREEVFITTKLWCDDHDPESVVPALQKSLSLLQLERINLYLMHFPVKLRKGASFPPKDDEFLPLDLAGTWNALEKCVHMGLTLAIGVSNFTIKLLNELLLHTKVIPAVNQVEMHPLWQQTKLRRFCKDVGIHVSAWSPLGAPGSRYGTLDVVSNPVIVSIAKRYKKTPAQVCLRWGIQSGSSILPRSYNPERITENMGISDWELTKEDIHRISNLPQQRVVKCEFFCNNVSSPYKSISDLWDSEV